MNAPGTCVDCGNEAYIQLAGEDETMICAHCFAARAHSKKTRATAVSAETAARREAVPAEVDARREAVPARRRAGG